MRIFVSYTTKDSYIDRELLNDLYKIISSCGDCYIDLLHNNANNKQHHVENMLSQADLLVLIESSSIVKSSWVQWELAEAKKNNIPIIVIKAMPEKSITLANLKNTLLHEQLTPY